MKTTSQKSIVLALTLLGSLVMSTLPVSCAFAQTETAPDSAKAQTLRPELGKIIQAAQVLGDAKNYKEALVKLDESNILADKTPYETFAVERTRATYFMGMEQKENAAKSLEIVMNTNQLKPADQQNIVKLLSQIYFQLADYKQSISWAERFVADGGKDLKMLDLLNKAYYLNKDYAKALKGFQANVDAEIAAGVVPVEQNFKLIAICHQELKDKEGALAAIELWNTYYPSVDNWIRLLNRLPSKQGFSEKLYLDLYRLKLDIGLLDNADDYVDMAETATRAALPAEAKKILEAGFAAKILGEGADAKKHQAQLDAANKRAAEDLKTMQQGEVSAAKNKEGTGLVNLGMAYATAGQFDKGISLIEQGIAKGLPRLEEAKLHLALVYYWAGKKEEAIARFNEIKGADGSGDIAHFWVLNIKHPMPKS